MRAVFMFFAIITLGYIVGGGTARSWALGETSGVTVTPAQNGLYADLGGKAPSAKKRLGGLIGAGGSAAFEGTVKYRLYALSDPAARLDSAASNNEGSTIEDSLSSAMPKVAGAVMEQVGRDKLSRPRR